MNVTASIHALIHDTATGQVMRAFTVQAETLKEALEKAADADPRTPDAALPVADRFIERGEPPVIAITDPAKSGGAVEIVRGRVLLRFTGDAGTVVSELCDPPPPPDNKPLVTVSLDASGKPCVKVEQGRARVRIIGG